VAALADLFAIPFSDTSGRVVAGDANRATRHLSSYPDDPTGYEAFVNHFHLEDTLMIPYSDGAIRALLVEVGRDLVKAWAGRLQAAFPEHSFLFYLGGTDSVALRFHVDRGDGREWANLNDRSFLRAEQIDVFRLDRVLKNEVLFALTRGSWTRGPGRPEPAPEGT
jgi:hypothetical protein